MIKEQIREQLKQMADVDYKKFSEDMKIKYKERVTDKINNVVENMDLISSVLDVLK